MRVLIAAGGTAGHINPALAIAGAIKKADPTAEIHFAGRKEGMEYRLVTQAGYPFHHIEITGFQRKLSLNNIRRNIITLWNLALSGPKAKKMMKDIQPDLVIGCGGYVSGPVVRCAARQGIKTALHEQNAFPGVTNKLLAPDVDIVFAAVPAAVEKLGAPEKTIVVGNPVRPEVFTQAKNREAIRAELGAGDHNLCIGIDLSSNCFFLLSGKGFPEILCTKCYCILMRPLIRHFRQRIQHSLRWIKIRKSLGQIDCPILVADSGHTTDDGIGKCVYSVT